MACPMCNTVIPKSRQEMGLNICPNCGHQQFKGDQKIQENINRRFLFLSSGLSLIAILAFIHSVHWNQYFFEIVPLKIKQSIGLANSYELQRVAKICRTQSKSKCTEGALAELNQRHNDQLEFLADYARILNFNNKSSLAIQAYRKYFAKGGTSLDAAFDFAKALSELQLISEANEQFEKVLNAKPNVMQYTVARAYVNHLVDSGQAKRAQTFIKAWQKRGINTQYFLESERQQIEKIIARN